MKMKFTVLAATGCLLTACAAPMVKPDGPSIQPRVGFVKDWDELADRTAANFVAQCQCDKRVVFVAPGPAEMPFATAYRKLLEDKLIRKGVAVSENALPASVVLTFEVQTFMYDHTGRLLPAVWIPLGAALDSLTSMYDTSRAEVLLTVSVSDGNFLRYRDPAEFYIRPSDVALYSVPAESDHWVNDNPAAGIREVWPTNDDGDHPGLGPLLDKDR